MSDLAHLLLELSMDAFNKVNDLIDKVQDKQLRLELYKALTIMVKADCDFYKELYK